MIATQSLIRDDVEIRIVHAHRARKLRKRGYHVGFYSWSAFDRPLYYWERPVLRR